MKNKINVFTDLVCYLFHPSQLNSCLFEEATSVSRADAFVLDKNHFFSIAYLLVNKLFTTAIELVRLTMKMRTSIN